jgi:hypothetical protein
MRLFYDSRGFYRSKNKNTQLLLGRVLWKRKDYWLLWISPSDSQITGFIVTPKTVYLYNIYLATNLWDAFKYFLKITKN